MNFNITKMDSPWKRPILLHSVSKKMTRNPSLDLISNYMEEIDRSLQNTRLCHFTSVSYQKGGNSSLCCANNSHIVWVIFNVRHV